MRFKMNEWAKRKQTGRKRHLDRVTEETQEREVLEN
jgi:hypothetical protein